MILIGCTFQEAVLIWCSTDDTYCEESSQPKHKVEVKDFYIGKYEVTNEQFCELDFMIVLKKSRPPESY
ncbi:MAG: SUMF1/EgtB/PvdO family nonheme iron enzyme [Bacteroidales bacterium]